MNNIKRYVGLSLSLCVKDILQGKVSIDDISGIICSSKFETPEDAVNYYYSIYFKPVSKKKALKVVEAVWSLIFQPRLYNQNHIGHMLSHGHWVDTYEGKVIIWK